MRYSLGSSTPSQGSARSQGLQYWVSLSLGMKANVQGTCPSLVIRKLWRCSCRNFTFSNMNYGWKKQDNNEVNNTKSLEKCYTQKNAIYPHKEWSHTQDRYRASLSALFSYQYSPHDGTRTERARSHFPSCPCHAQFLQIPSYSAARSPSSPEDTETQTINVILSDVFTGARPRK